MTLKVYSMADLGVDIYQQGLGLRLYLCNSDNVEHAQTDVKGKWNEVRSASVLAFQPTTEVTLHTVLSSDLDT